MALVDRYRANITSDTPLDLYPGALYVGEWGAGLTLQYLGADGSWQDFAQQNPGAEFRAPSTGEVNVAHASDGFISLKRVPAQ